MSGGPIAYIVGYYPAVSHTFIHREIDALRARGLDVRTVSLRATPPEDLLTEADRAEAARTWTVLPPAPREMAAAHVRAALKPGRYLRALRTALRTGPGGVRGALWQLFYFAEAVLVHDRLRREGVRHVHAHFANSASWVAMLVAELDGPGGIEWSFSMHGPTEFDDVTRFALPQKVASASFVACIGDYCRSQLMRFCPPSDWDKLALVRCGVDAGRFFPSANGDGPAASGDDGPLRVLCVGRLVPDKGQGVLLEAMALLRDRGVAVELTYVGDGAARPDLERRAASLNLNSSVRFAGSVGQDRILDHYRHADVFCLPSFAEGIPVVLMEALACEVPVVTSHIMGVPELVQDGVSGLLVTPGRADLLADALEKLAADAELRRAMGAAGRRRVADEFRLDRSAAELHRRFTSPIGAGSSA